MSSLFFQLLYFVFGCYLVCTVSVRVGKEIILKEPTKGETWHWKSDYSWTSTGSEYRKCTICATTLWFITTPFIKLPPLVKTIDVTIEYRVANCSTINFNGCPGGCSEEFDLRKLEVDERLISDKLGRESFNDTVKTIKSPNPGSKSTDVTTVTINSAGVYFALIDKNACQTLYSFEVSYKFCSKAAANLLVFEKAPVNTYVPVNEKFNNITGGKCVNNSVLVTNGTTPRAVCNSNGDLIVDSNATCLCQPGFQPSADFKFCVECPQCTFKADIGNEPCRNCNAKLMPNTNRTGCTELRINATCVEPSSSPTPTATTIMSTAAVDRPLLEMIIGLLMFILFTP